MHNSSLNNSDMVMDLALSGVRTNAANPPFLLSSAVTVRARSFDNGTWSALTEADFTVATIPATAANLAIAEMLYNPIGSTPAESMAGFTDGDQFEYLRLQNRAATAIALHGVAFVNGISFDFDTSAIRTLAPGAVALLVSDLTAFRARYGTRYDTLIAGQYSGHLNNGGERLRLIDATGAVIHDFTYQSIAPWPVLAGALDGHSIQTIDPAASHGDWTNWKASAGPGGTPGGAQTFATWRASQFSAAELANPAISGPGPGTDVDGDGLTTFAEFALGTPVRSAANGYPVPRPALEKIGTDWHLTLEFTRPPGNLTVIYPPQVSSTLSAWSPTTTLVGTPVTHPDGSVTARYRDPLPYNPANPLPRFLRLHMAE